MPRFMTYTENQSEALLKLSQELAEAAQSLKEQVKILMESGKDVD